MNDHLKLSFSDYIGVWSSLIKKQQQGLNFLGASTKANGKSSILPYPLKEPFTWHHKNRKDAHGSRRSPLGVRHCILLYLSIHQLAVKRVKKSSDFIAFARQ